MTYTLRLNYALCHLCLVFSIPNGILNGFAQTWSICAEGKWCQSHNVMHVNKNQSVHCRFNEIYTCFAQHDFSRHQWSTLLEEHLIAPPPFHYVNETATVECVQKCPEFHSSYFRLNEWLCILRLLKALFFFIIFHLNELLILFILQNGID